MLRIQELGVPEDVDHILLEGATLQAYRTGGGLAAARLIDKDSKDLLGYGVDDSVSSALSLACGSYAARELEYGGVIDLNHPDAVYDDYRTDSFTTKAAPHTRLDSFICAHTAIGAERDAEGVVAWTWSANAGQGLTARGDTLQAATQALLINSVKLH